MKQKGFTNAIKELMLTILIWFDKMRTVNHVLTCYHQMYGRFHVNYNEDNRNSQSFDYQTAKDYADIFGGRVIHDRTGRVVYTSQ